jgi:hypothetical protein
MIAHVAAATFGALLKVYDDIEDNPVIARYSSSYIMEIVKALIIASFTYASIHDMNLPIFIFIGEYLHSVISDSNATSTEFYHAGMIVALLLSIITFDASHVSVILIISIVGFILFGYIDHTLCPEEYSWKKIILRICYVIVLIIVGQLPVFIPYHNTVLFSMSYFMTSVIFMICAQYSDITPKEPKEPKEPKKPKEPKEPSQDASEKEIYIQVK